MADMSESDEENTSLESETKKALKYTKMTRELTSKVKKQKTTKNADDDEEEEENVVEFDEANFTYEDDEEYYEKLMKSKTKEIEAQEQEDALKMQLRLEREEAERQKAKEEEVKTKKDEDGTEYEWDPVVKGWFPKLPDTKFIEYQQTYGTVSSNNANATSNPTQPYAKLKENTFYLFNGGFFKWDFSENKWQNADVPVYEYVDYLTGVEFEWNQSENQWKSKNNPATEKPNVEEVEKPSSINAQKTAEQAKSDNKKKKEAGWFQIDDDKNTNVYVSGLPLDITDEEFEEMMSKYGIIMKDPSTHKLKVKLYKENNEVKGDGRCCYLMPESVKLCLQLLDGSVYKGHKITVEKAKFELKGNYDPSKSSTNEVQKKKLNKQKEKKLLEKQRQKLLDWEERPEIVRQKHEKVVVIKNIFNSNDLQNDKTMVSKLREDLKSELESYGDIKKILIHVNNPNGVVTVSFKDVEMADTCCEYLNNRVWKNGRIITCETWDGEEKFEYEETDEERQRRLDEWHKFLETDD